MLSKDLHFFFLLIWYSSAAVIWLGACSHQSYLLELDKNSSSWERPGHLQHIQQKYICGYFCLVFN